MTLSNPLTPITYLLRKQSTTVLQETSRAENPGNHGTPLGAGSGRAGIPSGTEELHPDCPVAAARSPVRYRAVGVECKSTAGRHARGAD